MISHYQLDMESQRINGCKSNSPIEGLNLSPFASRTERVATSSLETICGAVLEAARLEARRRNVQANGKIGEYPGHLEAMLGVLSYCYFKHVFTSVEIEQRLWNEPTFLTVFGSHTPTQEKIRAFRRRYRDLLEATIQRSVELFCRQSGQPTKISGIRDPEFARDLLNMATLMDGLNED